MVGWGDTGKAGDRKAKRGGGSLREARNRILDNKDGVLEYRFDGPKDDTFDNEGLSWAGDSGGPAFIFDEGDFRIAGVNSGGDCCGYGSVDQYKRLADAFDWIANVVSDDGKQIPGEVGKGSDFACTGGKGGDRKGRDDKDDHQDHGKDEDDHWGDEDEDDHWGDEDEDDHWGDENEDDHWGDDEDHWDDDEDHWRDDEDHWGDDEDHWDDDYNSFLAHK